MTSDEKALIALLVAAFLLSQGDIDAMAVAILAGRITSMKVAYSQASSTVGMDDPGWEPPDDLYNEAKDTSEQDAESIAGTYQADLEVQAEAFITRWMADHDSLDGCEAAARSELSKWAMSRAEWKSEQIANYSCGSGADDGTLAWIADLLDADLDLPDGTSLDDIEIEVSPAESSNDECKEYAGQRFAIEDAGDIIDFPAHPECPHRKVIVLKGE